jgi:hypothetical protein
MTRGGKGSRRSTFALALLLGCLALLVSAPLASASATILGKVTSGVAGPEFGDPLENIVVTAYEASTGDAVSDSEPVSTGPLGTYNLTVPTEGDYLIGFSTTFEHPADYARQFYPEKARITEAKAVFVGEGATKDEINAKLSKGATITGR